MSYYYNHQPYHNNYPNYGGYNNFRNYGNNYNRYSWGNPYTAYSYANRWNPGWRAYNYGFYNNCYYVYLKSGYSYRTVVIGPNYNRQNLYNGYYSIPYNNNFNYNNNYNSNYNVNGGYNVRGSIF